VLDLQPGVDLEEPERAGGVHDELDGARAGVAERLARGHRGRRQLAAQALVDDRRRALLDDLLVPALDRAVALEQRDDAAVRVAEDLHLDVAGVDDVALQEHGVVAERGRGLPRALATASASSCGVRRSACPRPPPPNAALTSTGKPMRAASA
jgi:hypothetical protein